MSKAIKQAQKRKRNRFLTDLAGISKSLGISTEGNGKASKTSRISKSAPEHTHYGQPDSVILAITIGLVVFGLLMVYSGSFYVASNQIDTIFFPGNPWHYLIMQSAWVLVGSVLAYIAYRTPIKLVKMLMLPAFISIIALLVLTLLQPGDINGAKSWIDIGFNGIRIQPSELAKPVLIVYLAAILARPWQAKDKFEDQFKMYLRKRLIPFALITAPIVLLVLAGKDFATAGVIGVTAFAVFFFADNSKIHNLFIGIVPVLGVVLSLIAVSLESFRQSRIATYLAFLKDGEIINPLSTGYQLSQIMIAVGSGGLTGYGFGQSKQKYFYLQETAFSDTIFAVAAEEFGLLGGLILLAALILFLSRGFKIARKLDNKFESLLCLGIVIWLSVQSFIHLGVNVGLLPLTGLTLPLVSYGGSSLLGVLVSIGLLLNISRKVKLD